MNRLFATVENRGEARKAPQLLSGGIALLLLVLWAGTTGHIAMFDICTFTPLCQVPAWLVLTPGVTFINATVGGLVSALVITQLAVTHPGDNPTILPARKRMPLVGQAKKQTLDTEKQFNVIVWFYLVVWMVVGLFALIVGLVVFSEANAALKDAGATWLGIAVAAAYAYFGIDPN